MNGRHRFFCPELNGETATLDAEESRHARRSLRLSAGDQVELFDGRGRVATGSIVDTTAGRSSKAQARSPVTVAISHVDQAQPPPRRLTLIVAACKGPRLSWLVEKCTELGAAELHFADFERSVVHVGDGQIEKLRRTAVEACKQCGRVWLPALHAGGGPLQLCARMTSERSEPPYPRPAALFVAHPGAEAEPLARLLADGAAVSRTVAVIGPEGGLTENELDGFHKAGGRVVTLAPHVLRVETAAAAVAAIWAGMIALRPADEPTAAP